jgi:hypothetical protein
MTMPGKHGYAGSFIRAFVCALVAFVLPPPRGIGTANERPALCDVIPPQYRSTALGVMNTFSTLAGALGRIARRRPQEQLRSERRLRQFFGAQPDGRTNHPLGRLKYTSGDIARVSKLAVS